MHPSDFMPDLARVLKSNITLHASPHPHARARSHSAVRPRYPHNVATWRATFVVYQDRRYQTDPATTHGLKATANAGSIIKRATAPAALAVASQLGLFYPCNRPNVSSVASRGPPPANRLAGQARLQKFNAAALSNMTLRFYDGQGCAPSQS